MPVTATAARHRFGRRCAKPPQQRCKAFNETPKDWLAEQNRDFAQNGLWRDSRVA